MCFPKTPNPRNLHLWHVIFILRTPNFEMSENYSYFLLLSLIQCKNPAPKCRVFAYIFFVNATWSKRSKSIFLSETNHDSLQVSNWGTDEKQVNTFLFKNHLQNRYIGEFLNSLNCFSDKEPKSFCASSCSSSRRKAHISRKLSDVLDIIACNSDFS